MDTVANLTGIFGCVLLFCSFLCFPVWIYVVCLGTLDSKIILYDFKILRYIPDAFSAGINCYVFSIAGGVCILAHVAITTKFTRSRNSALFLTMQCRHPGQAQAITDELELTHTIAFNSNRWDELLIDVPISRRSVYIQQTLLVKHAYYSPPSPVVPSGLVFKCSVAPLGERFDVLPPRSTTHSNLSTTRAPQHLKSSFCLRHPTCLQC